MSIILMLIYSHINPFILLHMIIWSSFSWLIYQLVSVKYCKCSKLSNYWGLINIFQIMDFCQNLKKTLFDKIIQSTIKRALVALNILARRYDYKINRYKSKTDYIKQYEHVYMRIYEHQNYGHCFFPNILSSKPCKTN